VALLIDKQWITDRIVAVLFSLTYHYASSMSSMTFRFKPHATDKKVGVPVFASFSPVFPSSGDLLFGTAI
jgi:hypothetical protein